MSERRAFEVVQSQRLDTAVAEAVPELSRAQAAKLVLGGYVEVDGAPTLRTAARVLPGAKVVVTLPPPPPTDMVAQDLPIGVVFEDAHLAVIDKAAGMVVHPGAGHPDGTLVNALLHHLDGLSTVGGDRRPGIVHRLDRGTSGLLVVAKTDVAHRDLQAQFADHSAGRVYLAFVHSPPAADAGVRESRLARHPTDRLRFSSVDPGRRARRRGETDGRQGQVGRHAVTRWEVLARVGTVGLVRCRLETGRTHQIRVHLTELGSPLLGDSLYRLRNARLPALLRGLVDPEGDRPLLHARTLQFRHPATGAALRFDAAFPDDFAAVAERLGVTLPP